MPYKLQTYKGVFIIRLHVSRLFRMLDNSKHSGGRGSLLLLARPRDDTLSRRCCIFLICIYILVWLRRASHIEDVRNWLVWWTWTLLFLTRWLLSVQLDSVGPNARSCSLGKTYLQRKKTLVWPLPNTKLQNYNFVAAHFVSVTCTCSSKPTWQWPWQAPLSPRHAAHLRSVLGSCSWRLVATPGTHNPGITLRLFDNSHIEIRVTLRHFGRWLVSRPSAAHPSIKIGVARGTLGGVSRLGTRSPSNIQSTLWLDPLKYDKPRLPNISFP